MKYDSSFFFRYLKCKQTNKHCKLVGHTKTGGRLDWTQRPSFSVPRSRSWRGRWTRGGAWGYGSRDPAHRSLFFQWNIKQKFSWNRGRHESPKAENSHRGDEEAGLQEKHSSMWGRVEMQWRHDSVNPGEASWRTRLEAGSWRMIKRLFIHFKVGNNIEVLKRQRSDDMPQHDHFQVTIITFYNFCFKQIAFEWH